MIKMSVMASDVETSSGKRRVKFTAKGIGFYVEMCQEKRSKKF